MTPIARKRRRDMTFPERLLWSRLRRGALGVEVRRQVPVGPSVVDFFVPSARLVVEVDGRSHDGRGAEDEARQARLEALGCCVVRVSNDDVLHRLEETVQHVRGAIEAQSAPRR